MIWWLRHRKAGLLPKPLAGRYAGPTGIESRSLITWWSPTSGIEAQHFLKLGQVLQNLAWLISNSTQAFFPPFLIYGPQYEVLVADDVRSDPLERVNKFSFQFVLMQNDQFTRRTVSAGLAEGQQAPLIRCGLIRRTCAYESGVGRSDICSPANACAGSG